MALLLLERLPSMEEAGSGSDLSVHRAGGGGEV